MSRIFIMILFISALCFTKVNTFAADFGDANDDGIITAYDAAILLQKVLDNSYKVPLEESNPDYLYYLDVNDDDMLTSFDCSFILQKVLNAAYVLPCEQVSENSTESSTGVSTEVTTERGTEVLTETITESSTETITEVTTEESRHIKIEIGEKSFDATLYDNAAADILIKQLPLSIEMDELNGNEKYYYFSDISFPTDSQRVGTINSGDLMLFGNDCLVLFYESFSTPYSYTPLGYVDDPTGLAETVGNGNITVFFNISE